MPRPVELAQAFLWTCEDCGRDTFERAVQVATEGLDLFPGDLRRIASEAEAVFLMAPDRVRCPHCGAEFETTEP